MLCLSQEMTTTLQFTEWETCITHPASKWQPGIRTQEFTTSMLALFSMSLLCWNEMRPSSGSTYVGGAGVLHAAGILVLQWDGACLFPAFPSWPPHAPRSSQKVLKAAHFPSMSWGPPRLYSLCVSRRHLFSGWKAHRPNSRQMSQLSRFTCVFRHASVLGHGGGCCRYCLSFPLVAPLCRLSSTPVGTRGHQHQMALCDTAQPHFSRSSSLLRPSLDAGSQVAT